MNWQDDYRQWFDVCDSYGEIIQPTEEEIKSMCPVQSKWYRTDGGIGYCKATNIFVRRYDYTIKYYRVTEESKARKIQERKRQTKRYLEEKLAEVIKTKEKIEQKLKELEI